MRLLFTSTLLFFSSLVLGQIGISAKYLNSNTRDWKNVITNTTGSENFLDTGLEFGINYWFRLKNHRIEFLPEIVYSKRSQDDFALSQSYFSAKMNSIGINTNIQIYPLDFSNDCNCPTFSKDGNLISKGFYWLISPGLAQTSKEMVVLRSDVTGVSTETIKSDNNIVAHIGLGAGLDIGIADLFTISPFAIYDFSFGHKWEELGNIKTSITSLNFGLRLMFRPDYVKQNRGLRR